MHFLIVFMIYKKWFEGQSQVCFTWYLGLVSSLYINLYFHLSRFQPCPKLLYLFIVSIING